ncbi:DUF393 domain-containing protein [Pseudomonas sp. B14-6]|uniref:DCC1-like thiol-disulfide oxidoreductase family protein n=1 Tax=Pseudomonas sp. B14-6 TaxID=2738843 RepID=UPI00155F3182|nr:DCC1-like thiol-disulfide oxidoreductase family protein [Pseudomonas sp. B14-6]QKG66082.1 DUF393 domain-containing protein [Pseudomonas sp. B14-6]
MTLPFYTQMCVFYLFSFAAVYAILRFIPAAPVIAEQWGKKLLIKAFPPVSDNEHYKFSILRALFGLILLLRATNIQLLLLPEERLGLIGLFSALDIIASFMLMVGLFTQVALAFSIFVMWQVGESVLGTSTLGNDIAAILSVLLLLTSAGKYLSVDALIIKRWNVSPAVLLYTKAPPDKITIALAKFAALFSYWLVCVYSLSMHINEPAWTTGIAGPLLLSNNFMSQWHAGFEAIFVSHNLANLIAKYTLWLMMAWYATILPFTLLGGLWRKYVIVWALMFFSLSMFVLNLGSLGEIEFVLWAAIFWPSLGVSSKPKLLLFYDDKCNMCDKTVQVLTYLDVFNRIRLMPVSKSADQLLKYNISNEEALTDLYGVNEETGKTFGGYDLYCKLAIHLVLLWPVSPLLWLGRLFGTGAGIYRIIAVRRRKLFGVCTLARPKVNHDIQSTPVNRPSRLSIAVVAHVMLLGTIYFFSIPAPYIGITGSSSAGTSAAHFYGIAPINVFNKTDLRMSENWFTLTDVESNTLLPYFNENGERLPYHKSDRVYFGYTLRFRRGEIDSTDCAFDRQQVSIDYLTRTWLIRSSTHHQPRQFTYTQYYQPIADNGSLLENLYTPGKRVVRCTQTYEVSIQ